MPYFVIKGHGISGSGSGGSLPSSFASGMAVATTRNAPRVGLSAFDGKTAQLDKPSF